MSKHDLCPRCGKPQTYLHDIGTEIRCGEVTVQGEYAGSGAPVEAWPARPKYEGDPPLDKVTQRFVDTVVADDPNYGGVEAVDLFHVLRKAGLSITITDRTDDLLVALERTHRSYIKRMSDGENSIIVRTKDEELAECYRLMGEALGRIYELEAEVERWREKDRRDLRGTWRP